MILSYLPFDVKLTVTETNVINNETQFNIIDTRSAIEQRNRRCKFQSIFLPIAMYNEDVNEKIVFLELK